MDRRAVVRTVEDVADTSTEGDPVSDEALLDLLAAARRTGRSPASLVLMAGRGEVTSERASDGSLRFDLAALDARLGVRSWRVSLDAPFW